MMYPTINARLLQLLTVALVAALFFATNALGHGNQSHSKVGDGNNINNCNPRVVCKAGVRTVTRWKTRVKIERRPEYIYYPQNVTHSNRISLLAGKGALGNLIQTDTEVRTERDLVLGLQYQRDVFQGDDVSLHLLIQAQTNKTFSGGIGLGF